MMQDPAFPSSHTTTTTTTTKVNTSIHFDPSYVKTIPGILKVAAVALNLLGFICIVVSENSYASRANWFNFVAMGGFWVSGILLVFYLMHLIEKFHIIPWLKLEFGFYAVWAFFYLTAAAACAAQGARFEAWGAAAFFGFCAMAVYGFDAFLKFKAWRGGEIAQGERMVQQSSTVTSPAY